MLVMCLNSHCDGLLCLSYLLTVLGDQYVMGIKRLGCKLLVIFGHQKAIHQTVQVCITDYFGHQLLKGWGGGLYIT